MDTKTTIIIVIFAVLITVLLVGLYVSFFNMYSGLAKADKDYCDALLREGSVNSSEYITKCEKK